MPMVYKKKAAILSVLAIVLALVYILSFVLDSGRKREKAFAWLDSSLVKLADRIELYGPWGITVLSSRNGVWVYTAGTIEYPVKQARVEGFLAVLSRKDAYTLRAHSSGAAEKLGLAEENATRIIVRGGAGLPLLDLLVGAADSLGREVYLKGAGSNKIYSGEDRLTLYTDYGAVSWFDLRLFARVDPSLVQQADIKLPGSFYGFTLIRSRGNWVLQGNEGIVLDSLKTDNWLRSVLQAEGEDFIQASGFSVQGSITLHLGDGTSRSVHIWLFDNDENQYCAAVSGSDAVYLLSEAAVNRLFRESVYFIDGI